KRSPVRASVTETVRASSTGCQTRRTARPSLSRLASSRVCLRSVVAFIRAHAARRGQRPGHRSVTVLLQPQREAAALAGLAPDLDLAAQEPRVLLRDREAEPGPGAAARRVGLVEALEQVRQVLGRDP